MNEEKSIMLVRAIVLPIGNIVGTFLGFKIWEIIFYKHYLTQILELLTK